MDLTGTNRQRRADAGKRTDHLFIFAIGPRRASRKVDPRKYTECAATRRLRRCPELDYDDSRVGASAPRGKWRITGPIRYALRAIPVWIRWASRSKIIMPSASGAKGRQIPHRRHRESFPDGRNLKVRRAREDSERRPTGLRENYQRQDAHLCAGSVDLESYDTPAVEKIAAQLAAHDYKFDSLVLGIVESLPFQERRALHDKNFRALPLTVQRSNSSELA